MPQFSEISLIGHVGSEPLVSTTGKDNLLIAKFSIAYGRKRGDKETTTWYRCTAFGRLAQLVQQYVHKGDPLFVRGECYQEVYQKDGQDRVSLEVSVDKVTFLKARDAERPKDAEVTRVAEKKAAVAAATGGDDEPPF